MSFPQTSIRFIQRSLPLIFFILSSGLLSAEPVRIAGSGVVAPAVSDSIKPLQNKGMEIDVSSAGGASAGISHLGSGEVQIALLARHIEPQDRAAVPESRLIEYEVGRQVAALCVSADVWNSGIHALSAEQIRGIYEGRIRNWKELGGADQKISFFNWEEGAGMWELLADWLYESASRAPKGKFQPVDSNEAARNAIEFTWGGIALMSPKFATGKLVFPLALIQNKQPIAPSIESLVSGKYPLSRPLVLVTDGKPTGRVKVIIEHLLSPEGQMSFSKMGFFTASEIKGSSDLKDNDDN